MEDESMHENEDTRSPWENDPSKVPEFYASIAAIDETAFDVSLVFGSFFKDGRAIARQTCNSRVVMSHSAFLRFSDEIAKEAQFLRRLYKMDSLPLIANVPDDEWRQIAKDIYGNDSDE